jgi:ABC-type bacteriocin/lantibiotic exporter with double-glycine peptidase domain
LLLIGGYLVINQQINIGQFVAAEIIILLIINSVEKIIIGLETFYDLLTSIEKIGQIVDLDIESATVEENNYCFKNIFFEIDNLNFSFPDSDKKTINNISLKINQGETIYLDGINGSGKTTFLRILAGLIQTDTNSIYINDENYKRINIAQYRSQIGVVTAEQSTFEGTIYENITFNNKLIQPERLRWVLEKVKLTEEIKKLSAGLDEIILADGKQLSSSTTQKILLARAIINYPAILFLEAPFDKMDREQANEIIDFIVSKENNWTVIVTSKNDYWKEKCERIITLDQGQIISDTK